MIEARISLRLKQQRPSTIFLLRIVLLWLVATPLKINMFFPTHSTIPTTWDINQENVVVCVVKQCFSFQRRYTSQKEIGHSSVDITAVVSCKCKRFVWQHPLFCSCSPSMCYHLNRNCQVLIIKMCEVHIQIRRVYIQFMSPWESKCGKLDQFR